MTILSRLTKSSGKYDLSIFSPQTIDELEKKYFHQKWHDKINPKVENYPIFMAVSENSGKDNSGKEIYELDKNREPKLDEHNHIIQKHDLKEIADAFEVWAKEQKLSFWRK